MAQGHCDLIFEVGNYRQVYCWDCDPTVLFTMLNRVAASDSSSESVASAGTLSLLATATELSAISTIDDVLEWADIEALVWKALVANLGRVGKLHFFAALPHEVLVVAITAARVEPQGRTLTPMEATQVGLSWRVARQRFGLPDVALEDSHPPILSTSTTARVEEAMRIGGQLSEELGEDVPHGEGDGHGDGIRRMRVEEKLDDALSTVTATMNKIDDDRLSQKHRKVKDSKVVRKVKFASVIDQCDDGEVLGLGQAQIDEHFERIRLLKGSFPLADPEPTNDQISAMRSRVVSQGLAPYADFAVFVLRFAKLLRYQSHTLQSDGTFLTVESPGPANWHIWYASWKVYTNALLGLVHTAPGGAVVPVVDCACLEEYVENLPKTGARLPRSVALERTS